MAQLRLVEFIWSSNSTCPVRLIWSIPNWSTKLLFSSPVTLSWLANLAADYDYSQKTDVPCELRIDSLIKVMQFGPARDAVSLGPPYPVQYNL